jgi:hypothetical protein
LIFFYKRLVKKNITKACASSLAGVQNKTYYRGGDAAQHPEKNIKNTKM